MCNKHYQQLDGQLECFRKPCALTQRRRQSMCRLVCERNDGVSFRCLNATNNIWATLKIAAASGITWSAHLIW